MLDKSFTKTLHYVVPGLFKFHQTKTGKDPADFRAMADEKGFTKDGELVVKASDVTNWLKADFELGHRHAWLFMLCSKALRTRIASKRLLSVKLIALVNDARGYFISLAIMIPMQKILKSALAVFVITLAIACGNEEKKKPAADSTAMAKSNTVAAPASPAMEADTGHLVGAWHDEAIKSDDGKDIAYEVISKGNKVYIQAITFTGKELTLNDAPPITASASEIRKDGDKYVGVNSPTEIYKVDKKGNLLIYDGDALVAICKKIL